ncbi:C40 family peptidase [Actinoplanes sp. L3-i22]|uniref:C40 family peptidase n=1 Tax=Actinoplanes sp. L3-i22 TaxID=2836373 RepID=UPI001C76C048|nr:C40 family peptidase [Actinoplanes sp. L3-i22]BCY10972.1 lipoprotein [Actinoplanes sp. L3-i22]
MTGRTWAWVAGGSAVLLLAPCLLGVAAVASFGTGTTCTATSTTSPGPSASTAAAGVGNWSAEQTGNAATIVTVGTQLQVPRYGWVIAVATAMQESTLHNYGDLGARNDHDSLGLFQQRPSQGWGSPAQILQPDYAAGKFYQALLRVDGWQTMPLTQAAQQVQRSAYPDAYAKWQPESEQLVDAISSGLGVTCTSDEGDGLPGEPGAGIPAGYTLPSDAQQATAVRFALAQVGKPYVFGAAGPDSYDCSGLMQKAWAAAGVTIPRVTTDQVHTGTAVTTIAAMQPGDLIFIPGSDGTRANPRHVGMYIGTAGDGRPYLVQAPKTGDVVKVTPVSSWRSQIAAIRRPVTR